MISEKRAKDFADTIRFGGIEDVRTVLNGMPSLDLNSPMPESVSFTGQNCLMIACEQTDLPVADKVISLLLDRGADATLRNRFGKQPIHYLAERGAENSTLLLLLEAGADMDALCQSDNSTPLHGAATKKALDTIEFLLEAGADSEALDGEGRSAADYLSPALHLTTLEKIEANVVPPKVSVDGALTRDALLEKNEGGACALDAGAIWTKSQGLLGQLEENGEALKKADVMEAGKNGKRLATRAVEFGGGEELVRHMAARGNGFGADDLLQNGEPNDLLQAAIDHGQVGAFFTVENWSGREHSEMVSVYRALPEAAKPQVNNYFSLQNELRRNAPRHAQIGR